MMAEAPVILTSRISIRYWDPERRVREWEHARNQASHGIVANCVALAEECIAVEGVDASKVRVIRNGIAIPPAPARRNGVPDPVVGTMANLRATKGHDVLLHALAKVPAARAICCGADYGIQSRLEALRDSLGLASRVTFAGVQQDIESFYNSLDLYVQASSAEGLSTAVLEAMARGIAVVATDVGGTREAVVHEETGLLVPSGDAEALAAAIHHLLEQAELRRSMGEAGRARACAGFDVSRVVQEHIQYYEELLAHALPGI
jgi:glycosyltransferase involved in cell wall biosynthesis